MKTNKVEDYKDDLRKQIANLNSELSEIENWIKSLYGRISSINDATKEERDEFHNKCDREREIKGSLKVIRLESLPTDEKYFSRFLYTDVEAHKCVKEFTSSKVGIIRMIAKETEDSRKKMSESFVAGGFCGHTDNSLQEWSFEMPEYTDDDIIVIRKHKDGFWYDKDGGRYGIFDHPYEFYDHNF